MQSGRSSSDAARRQIRPQQKTRNHLLGIAMSKQQLAEILAVSAQNPPPVGTTPGAMRAWMEDALDQVPVAENVAIRRGKCGPCDGDLIIPAGRAESRLVIFYHGGGFFFGSSRTHRVIASNLARTAGSVVLLPDYRLA